MNRILAKTARKFAVAAPALPSPLRVSSGSCGCAMGARFLAAALVISIPWYLWQWHASALSTKAALVRIVLWSFLAAGSGKLLGIAIWKFSVNPS